MFMSIRKTTAATVFALLVALAITAGYLLAGSVTAQTAPAPCGQQDVIVYEDGSGVQYDGDTEVRTFPKGTFAWNFSAMGTRRSGPGQED